MKFSQKRHQHFRVEKRCVLWKWLYTSDGYGEIIFAPYGLPKMAKNVKGEIFEKILSKQWEIYKSTFRILDNN